MTEQIGKVILNLDYYCGEDLYSDGDEVENHILDIVKNETNYDYYHKDFCNWPVLYHLSRQRENIVEPMDIGKDDMVLEVGAGMGAVSGALARKCQKLDCIELSKRRSTINAHRHKDMDNIEIFVGNFQDIEITKKYDVITLIGVLEYAYHYINSRTPYEDFILKIASCLKPGGKLYIAIENKLGMKYFSGYHEDHLGIPYKGIEGYQKSDKVKTFSKSQLEKLVLDNGFSEVEFYYPLPDYKFPTVIYNEKTIRSMDIDYSEQVNYDLDTVVGFRQVDAMKSLRGSKEVSVFSNSFLVEAVKE